MAEDWVNPKKSKDWVNPNRQAVKPETQGWKGVGEDVKEGVYNLRHIPRGLWEMAKAAPGQINGMLDENPRRFAKNTLAGLGQLGQKTLSIPHNIVEYGKKKGLIPKEYGYWKPEDFDFKNNSLYQLGEERPGDALAQALPELAAFGGAGEIGNLGRLGRYGARAASYGTEAIANNQNPITAALLSPALDITGHSMAYLAKNLGKLSFPDLTSSGRYAKKAKGLLSPEELNANVRAAEGTNTPLPNIVGSPQQAKRFINNTLPAASESVSDELLKTLSDQIDARAKSLVERGGQNPATSTDNNALTQQLLKASRQESRKIKNDLYNPVSELAEKEGLQFELPKFKEMALENAQAIENSPILMNDASFKALYNKLSGLSEASATPSSLADIKLVLNELGKEGGKMQASLSSAERSQGQLLTRLANAGRNDIKATLKEKGSPEIQSQYNKAEDYYSSEYSKFLDQDIHNLLKQSKDPQAIVQEIIKPSKTSDKHTMIDKVTEILPENKKGLLGDTYLQGAIDKEGAISPQKVNQLINGLGKRQFISLFPDKAERQALLDFSRLTNMNQKAINRWFNPETGAKNNEMLARLINSAKGGGAGVLLGEIMGGYLGMPHIGGFLGGAIGSTTKQFLTNKNVKALTGEKFKQKVLDKMKKANNKSQKSRIFTDAQKEIFSKALPAASQNRKKD